MQQLFCLSGMINKSIFQKVLFSKSVNKNKQALCIFMMGVWMYPINREAMLLTNLFLKDTYENISIAKS